MVDNLAALFTLNLNHDLVDTLAIRNPLANKILSYKKSHYVMSNNRSLAYIAHDIYGSVDYWTILAIYNNVVDPFKVPEIIYYIPLEELRSLIR